MASEGLDEPATRRARLVRDTQQGAGITLSLRMSLNNAQRLRSLESAVYYALLIPTSEQLVQLAVNAGKSYATQCKTRGKQHGLGPPHVHCWHSLTRLLGTLQAWEPATDLQTIRDHQAAIEGDQRVAIENVTICKIKKAHQREGDQSKHLLQLAVRPMLARQLNIMLQMMVRICHATMLDGQAPASAMEREAQAMLD